MESDVVELLHAHAAVFPAVHLPFVFGHVNRHEPRVAHVQGRETESTLSDSVLNDRPSLTGGDGEVPMESGRRALELDHRLRIREELDAASLCDGREHIEE